mgnify:FL=1
MRREYTAMIILAILMLGAWLNLRHMDSLTERIEAKLELSQKAAEQGSMDISEKALLDALDMWLGADGYTHIFIRHSEIDAISDSFYELYDALLSGETDALAPAYEKLIYHLESVNDIEHLSLRSLL